MSLEVFREMAASLHRSTTIQELVADGRFYIVTSNQMSVSGTGDSHVRALVSNPVGSGVNVLIFAIVVASDVSGNTFRAGELRLNPDTNLPATQFTPVNQILGHSRVALGEFFADAGGDHVTGGQLLDAALAAHGGRTVIELPGTVVSPGVSVGYSVGLGLLESSDALLAVYFGERDA